MLSHRCARTITVVAGLAIGLTSSAAFAQTWDGSGIDNNWSTGGLNGNWSGAAAPVSDNNTFIFFSASPRLISVQDISPTTPFRLFDLTFNASAGAYVLSGGPIRFSGGRLFQHSASNITINNDLSSTLSFSTTAAPLQVGGTGSGSVTLNGVLSTIAGIQKIGAFDLIITNPANTFTGQVVMGDSATNASGGALVISSLGALGTATVSLNGGSIFRVPSDFVMSRAIAVGGTNGGVLDVPAGATLSCGGAISGSGSLNKSGAGTLDLQVANSITGVINLNGGTTIISAANRLGTAATAVTFSNNAVLSINGTTAINRAIATSTGGGTIDVPNPAVTVTASALFSGTTLLTKTGAGTLVSTTTSNNSNSGGVYIAGGSFLGVRTTSFGTGPIRMADGTRMGLTLIAPSAMTNPITLDGAATLDAQANFDWTISSAITGVGPLTKAGIGRLSLTSVSGNNITGNLNIAAGEVRIGGAFGGGGGATIAAGASLAGSGGIGGTVGGAGMINPGVLGAGIFTIDRLDGSAGTDFSFEIAGPTPTYGVTIASTNDVLRLKNPAPFAGPLGAGNTMNLYLRSALGPINTGDVYRAGFFTDNPTDFQPQIQSAAVQLLVENPAGSVVYQGVNYSVLVRRVAIGTAPETAAFATGTVNGRVMTITMGPPPCNAADIVGVGGLPPGDGILTGDDFVAFTNAFANDDLLADITGIGGPPAIPDGLITGDDFVAFINAFAAGCP